MSWPFVSRDRLDAMQRLLDIAHAEARQERSIADARYDALLEKYQALKVAGAVEAPKPTGYTNAPPSMAEVVHDAKPDELRTLINLRAGTSLRKRSLMLAQLVADRAAGVNDDVIRKSIEQGIESSGVPA